MRGLIAAVEGPSRALVKSIERLEPEVICWYFSGSAESDLREIRKNLANERFDNLEIIIDQPEDFHHCFEKATEAVEKLADRTIYPNDTLLDYTGGTKVMSSALVAATLGRGFRYALVAPALEEGFRYVYMAEERKANDGSRYIEGGMEEILSSKNPWEIRALESKRKIRRNFNNYRFKSVIDQIDSLEKGNLSSDRDQYLLNAIRELAEGYSRWDRFHYEGVKEKLRRSTEDFKTYRSLARPENHLTFSVEQIRENIQFLNDLQEETFGFDYEKRVGHSLAVDMFWNAIRRAEEGKYDDGIVRLYRTVEMFGQVEIHEELGHHTDAVPLELIPEDLRGDLNEKPGKEEVVELGLHDNYQLLGELGNELGEKFLLHEEDFKKIMRTRNTSFLTHNFKAIEESQFEALKDIIAGIFEINQTIQFPNLEID